KPYGHPVDEVGGSGGTVGVDTQMFGPPASGRDPSGRHTVYGRAGGPALVATPHVPLVNQGRIGAQRISECGLEGGIPGTRGRLLEAGRQRWLHRDVRPSVPRLPAS